MRRIGHIVTHLRFRSVTEKLPKHRAGRNNVVNGLLADYRSDTYDEMVDADGAPRAHTKSLYEALELLSAGDLEERGAVRARSFLQQGITFSSSGEEWVFPLDLVPRFIAEDEWDHIEAGVVQRVRALEAFLDDIYGDRSVLRDGVVPHSLVFTSSNFCRAAAGIRPASGVRIHLAGIDLVRGADGVMRVLEDNLRVPSGISYVIENREALTRVFPGLFLEQQVQPVAGFVATLLDSLRAAAPAAVSDPTVVLLSPGIYNSAYFEHAFLARKMGIELVEGRDLVCRDNVLYMRTTAARHVSTSSTGGSTTTSSTRCSSGRTPSSARPACSTPPVPVRSRSPTRWATAWPTTS